jgi:hypothetical protein
MFISNQPGSAITRFIRRDMLAVSLAQQFVALRLYLRRSRRIA